MLIHQYGSINRFVSKKSFIFLIILLKTFVESKFYEDYISFENCYPRDLCPIKTYPELYKTYIQGLGSTCEDEFNLVKTFFACADRYFECGYMNLYKINNSSSLNPLEGVNILNGIDLMNFSQESMKALGVNDTIINKLTPFFGLKGHEASNKLESERLSLSKEDGEHLYEKLYYGNLNKLKQEYSKFKPDFTDWESNFSKLSIEAKTGLISQMNIYGNIPNEYKNLTLNNLWDPLSVAIKKRKFPSDLKNGNITKNILRKNLDAYLIDSIDSKIQASHLKGVFVIDLTNAYKAELLKYETYINTIKYIIKDFFLKEKCDFCPNKNIHEYSILVYRDEFLQLTDFGSDYQQTMVALDRIIVPNWYLPDPRTRNTGKALNQSIEILIQKNMTFDKLKTIFLFSNGDPEDELDLIKQRLIQNSINLAVLDMSLGKAKFLPLLAEGRYNYLSYDVEKYINSTANINCLNKQISNIFASQNILLTLGKDYKNSTIDHNNTVFFQAVRPKFKNLKISLYLNTFPEENFLKIFVSYNYPLPDYETSLVIHEGDNYLPLKTVVIGDDPDRPELFENDRTVYFALQGSNSDFGLKIEECDPTQCKVGTNIAENDYPFPKWILAILIILATVISLYFIWYLIRCYRKKDTNHVEGAVTEYHNI